MKIQPTTLGLLLAALTLGSVVALVAQQPAPKPADDKSQTVTEAEQPLFTFPAADIQSLTLKTRLHSLKFERDQDGKWQMLEPEKTAASDPSLAFLLDLLASDKTPRTLTVPLTDREQFGLHQPTATIDLTLKDQKTHQLVIGEYDFNRTHFYAQIDPPADAKDLQVVLVSPNFDNAVNRPLDEWKADEKSSQKASPEPSESASPSVLPETPPETPPEASPNSDQ
ncbi:MAG: DUF4340 domain-containing protein [Pegethrix bostrychoides GSE-TBD4-15B]|jgi:hypothetical protein|uniref:DUF4340 domain-containing protein n=1 Tax=Pegethrix bostrychoides GSE-TBD4-15B TaxID=2839662 RepID=A0A951P7A2_9CYAN|nr:DUF4340 domain-containing protein [Pegethrix bostrychoides GSE-TBD4-15B]